MFKKSIYLRVHHALNFAQWVKEGRSDDELRSFLRSSGYDENAIETSVSILQKFREPNQKVRILGFRDLKNDEVCKNCTTLKIKNNCALPPKEGFGDKDSFEAERYDINPSIFPTKSKEVQQQLRPKWRGFFR
ncbi:MAG: hypothetical protein WC894_02675 [Patescibacteria group bacterium]